MLPKRQARLDLDTLTWEYLDGRTSPTRLAHLETLLRTRKDAREAFVEHSTLDAMLHSFFRQEAANAEAPVEPVQTRVDEGQPVMRRKRRRGRANAA